MGWSSGSRLLSDIIDDINQEDIEEEHKKIIYRILIEHFENFDCDTIDECLGEDKSFDLVYREFYPDDDEDEEEDDWED